MGNHLSSRNLLGSHELGEASPGPAGHESDVVGDLVEEHGERA